MCQFNIFIFIDIIATNCYGCHCIDFKISIIVVVVDVDLKEMRFVTHFKKKKRTIL